MHVESGNDGVVPRVEASRLAPFDTAAALSLARSITEPWYRCQALAKCARYMDVVSEKNAVLDDAFQAALIEAEPNRVVSVSAWPLKVLALSGQDDMTAEHCDRLLKVIGEEPSPVRRGDALLLLLGASAFGPRNVFESVLAALLETCNSPLSGGRRNRRGKSQLYEALSTVAYVDPTLLESIVELIDGPELSVRARNWATAITGSPKSPESIPPYLG